MEGGALFADVIVPVAVPNRFTYRVPVVMSDMAGIGKRVIVQFGRTKLYTGIIWRLHDRAPAEYTAKYIEAVLDDHPVVSEQQLRFWDWLAFYYCANPGDVLNAALPSALKLQSTSVVVLHPDFNAEESEHGFLSEKESLLVEALLSSPMTFADVAQLLDVKTPQSIVHRLQKKKVVVVQEDLHEKFRPKIEVFVRLVPNLTEKELQALLDTLEKRAFRQAEALLLLLHLYKTSGDADGWVKRALVLKQCEPGAVRALVKKGVFEEKEMETGRLQFESRSTALKALSPAQLAAYEGISSLVKTKPVLLHGVTGSGKTEVYIRLMKDALEAGRDVLMLIPEIALTTQLITRLQAAFGDIVGVYHSRFSSNERVEIWNNLLSAADGKEQRYRVILGARSSLFLPFRNLGLIIIDEEHDSSFKQQDPAPRYHARDAALYLAHSQKAGVVLGSATPSAETYFQVKEGKYGYITLDEQFVKGGGTTVEVCDTLYYTQSNQMRASLTPPLFSAVQSAIDRKEQVILFQNRRGFAPYTECRHCGHVPHCVQCDVSLIYHKQQQKLVCHYCGYSLQPLSSCPACGSNDLHFKGMGTEKIEEDVEVLFPNGKIARMDLDSTRSKYAYRQLIDDFENGETDILIGTQMVTKGLDFGNVAVVGVLNADSLLNFPDFRSFERAYQLLTQVRGRAGRGNRKGKVFIQTTQPEHAVIKHVKDGTWKGFMDQLLDERRQFGYPPFSRLVEVNVVSRDPNEVNHLSQELYQILDVPFHGRLLGPEFPIVSRIRNEYYKRILIKVPRQAGAGEVRTQLRESLAQLGSKYRQWRYRTVLDVDPV